MERYSSPILLLLSLTPKGQTPQILQESLLKPQLSAFQPIRLEMQSQRMQTPSKSQYNWLSWTILVIVFTVACWFLSQWQFDRQNEVVAKNKLIEANYNAEAKPLGEVLEPNQAWENNLEFRSVSVTGKYLPEQNFLVRNRPLNAYPGFLQLVAFRTEPGTVIWVERCWLLTMRLRHAASV